MFAAPARWPCSASWPTALRPAAVAVEHHPDVLGQPVGGEAAHDARLVGRVEHPPEPVLPVRHGEQPYSGGPPVRCRSAPLPLGDEPPHRTTRHRHAPASTERIGEQVRETLDEVKPKLRGWMHAASAPLTLAAGIVLVVLSPTAPTRIGSAVFATSALVLFTVSGDLPPRHLEPAGVAVPAALRPRQHLPADRRQLHAVHAAAADGTDRVVLLSVVWTGAVLGVLFRVFWNDAPALALHPDLHGARLGGGVLLRRLRRRTRAPPCWC